MTSKGNDLIRMNRVVKSNLMYLYRQVHIQMKVLNSDPDNNESS